MPITAPAAPPKKAAKNTTATANPGVTVNAGPLTGKSKDRADGLLGWFQIAQVVCLSKGWLADSAAIGIHGPKLATETARTAEKAEPLGKVLDFMAASGPYAALLGAALPLVAQIMVNHNVLPESAGIEGVVPPAMLEAQIKAELAEMQLESLRMQKEAEAKVSELQAALNGAGS